MEVEEAGGREWLQFKIKSVGKVYRTVFSRGGNKYIFHPTCFPYNVTLYSSYQKVGILSMFLPLNLGSFVTIAKGILCSF